MMVLKSKDPPRQVNVRPRTPFLGQTHISSLAVRTPCVGPGMEIVLHKNEMGNQGVLNSCCRVNPLSCEMKIRRSWEGSKATGAEISALKRDAFFVNFLHCTFYTDLSQERSTLMQFVRPRTSALLSLFPHHPQTSIGPRIFPPFTSSCSQSCRSELKGM
jgi:hypothetical protein